MQEVLGKTIPQTPLPKGVKSMTEIELIKLAQKRDKQKQLWMLLSSPSYDLAKWDYWIDYIRANKN